ncbi:MAG: hypothetical protein P8Y44_01345 [Acidobacteriota bacterium]
MKRKFPSALRQRKAHPTVTAMLCGLLITVAAVATSGSPATSREIVDRMIAAHGGMDAWAGAPTVSFEDEWRMGDAASGNVSRVTVEQGQRRAYIDYPGSDMRMAWDGSRAWSENWQAKAPPRFLALLNYYFLNLPWLTRDPGVILAPPQTGQLWDDPVQYLKIRMTFDSGTGDTPDDYYVLYIDPQTYRLKACEYVVTYRDLLPEGVEASQPHVLVYDEYVDVDGLLVPSRFTIYELDRSVYASCWISDWSFSNTFDASRMTMPAGATVDESKP